LEAKRHREGDNKILIVGSNAIESYNAIEKIKNGFSFKTEFAAHNEIKDIDIAEYFIVVAVGSFEKEILQSIFERVRFSDNTRFYHISE